MRGGLPGRLHHFGPQRRPQVLHRPDNCIDCGSCEQACPNKAIFRADSLPAEWAGFAWVDATWYVDPAGARAAIDAYLPAPVA